MSLKAGIACVGRQTLIQSDLRYNWVRVGVMIPFRQPDGVCEPTSASRDGPALAGRPEPDKPGRCYVRALRRAVRGRPTSRRIDEHMSRGSDRSHAWLPRKKGAAEEPFLPKVGELYLVSTIVYSFGYDPAADRPAVVIFVPSLLASHSPIQLVTRTSRRVPGVSHPADASLKCDRDGVFSDLVSVEQQLWRPENVECLGVLPEPFLSAVLGRFS
jgi:hypothetical protein